MAKKRPAPRLFDVLPAGLMRQSLAESLPKGTKGVWEHVGSMRVTGGMLGALDAGSCHPRYLPSEAKQLDWPYPQADLAVRFAEHSDGKRSRVLAVLVAAPAAKLPRGMGDCERESVEGMAIDSATGVIGDYARMLTECRAGGPQATVLVGRGEAKTAVQKRHRKQAAQTLRELGLPVASEAKFDGKSPVEFSVGLSDEQIEQARSALAAAGVTEEIWVPSAQTAMHLGKQLLKSLIVWDPDSIDPWLLAFHTGFGDGMYDWQAITMGDKLSGYLCDFLPESESESEAEEELDEPEDESESVAPTICASAVGSPVFPADLAPPLEPGINVAAKGGGVFRNWFLGKLLKKTEKGYSVRFKSGTVDEVEPSAVVPMPTRAVFQPGDVVLAHSGGGDLKPAVVRAVSPKNCQVEWHAKEPLLKVPLGELTFAEWLLLAAAGNAPTAPLPTERKTAEPPQPVDAAPAFGPGVAVAVRMGKKSFWIGRIIAASGDGFQVEYPTGNREKVKLKNLVPVPARHIFRTGDAVIALWSGAAMYPGKIIALSPFGYTIAWDDGSGPQIVPLGSLTFLAWT